MPNDEYKVVFKGKAIKGHDTAKVKQKFSVLFKTDLINVNKLFSGKSFVIKKAVSKRLAEKYYNALIHIGADAVIERLVPALEYSGPYRVKSNTQSKQPHHTKTISCPKCSYKQEQTGRCKKCGIFIEKYLKQKLDTQNKDLEANEPNIIQDAFDESLPEPIFFEELTKTFAYPFQGNNKYILIAGTILLIVQRLLETVPIINILIVLVAGGYISAYLMKATENIAFGQHSTPEWLNWSDYWEDIIKPVILSLGTFACCFGPLVYYTQTASNVDNYSLATTQFGLTIAGLVYFPMAWLYVSISRSLLSLNPFLIVSAITHVPTHYFIANAIFIAIYLLGNFYHTISNYIPFVGNILVIFCIAYLALLGTKVVGLVYQCNQSKLN